jgi:hypothetical protein
MKKIFTLVAGVLAFTQISTAQVGAVAQDFTVTDINGTTHNLYNILDSGKVVVLDCSATWCPPCWGFHQQNYLHDINTQMGPHGTDEVRVIFYEADPATNSADLNGTGTNTQGDWVTGVDYPIVDEASPSLSGANYWPLGYPTINVICPGDRKIKGDLFDVWNSSDPSASLTAMIGMINSCPATTLETEELNLTETTIFPNPTNGDVSIQFNAASASDVTISISTLLGQILYTDIVNATTGMNAIDLSLTDLQTGQYIVKIDNGSSQSVHKLQIKK